MKKTSLPKKKAATRRQKLTSKKVSDIQLKYQLYENSVQSPESDIQLFDQIYKDINHKKALILREDFCGTFSIASEWVKSDKNRKAIALDIDPEPLKIGFTRIETELSPQQRKRLKIHQQNVINPSVEKAEMIIACNFSFYVLQDRQDLLSYCSSALKSLKAKGVFALEMVGGSDFIEAPHEERKKIEYPDGPKKGKSWFTYIWDQQAYNPINAQGRYAIHFNLSGGKKIKNAFIYDWRIWTIPEVNDCLREVGFKQTHVYWTRYDRKGEPTDHYIRTNQAENDDVWIAYIIGVKK